MRRLGESAGPLDHHCARATAVALVAADVIREAPGRELVAGGQREKDVERGHHARRCRDEVRGHHLQELKLDGSPVGGAHVVEEVDLAGP